MKYSDLIPLSKLAVMLPGCPSLCSMHRWRLRGIHGVKLKTYLCGGRRYGTLADAEEFFEQVTAAANGKRKPSRTSRQREAEITPAEKEFDEAGIK